jgi:hypothetical protein
MAAIGVLALTIRRLSGRLGEKRVAEWEEVG